jgi:hypothetical protein
MANQLPTIAIILSLGTAGCAGLSAQQASSLGGHAQDAQGLDPLWLPAERAATAGVQAPPLGGEAFGALWQSDTRTPTAAHDGLYHGQRTSGDLWNPASAVHGSRATPSLASKSSKIGGVHQ